ncbi:MAG: cyclic nucleotide-binding domain-containing protein, partial [Rhodospirillales bacterium]|nr:cyclic nucleotide-binding domain-containing protein [Rhodospirillales bacterium]
MNDEFGSDEVSPDADDSSARTARSLDLATLRAIDIFRDLPIAVLHELAAIGEIRIVREQEILCRQGERADRLHVLIEGQIALSNTAPNGTSAVVEVVRPGGHFVLATVLAKLPYLLNAQAVTPSRVVVLPA